MVLGNMPPMICQMSHPPSTITAKNWLNDGEPRSELLSRLAQTALASASVECLISESSGPYWGEHLSSCIFVTTARQIHHPVPIMSHLSINLLKNVTPRSTTSNCALIYANWLLAISIKTLSSDVWKRMRLDNNFRRRKLLGSTGICNQPGYAISDNPGGYLPGRLTEARDIAMQWPNVVSPETEISALAVGACRANNYRTGILS